MFDAKEDIELIRNSYSTHLISYAQRTIQFIVFCCIGIGCINTAMWLSVYFFPEIRPKFPFFLSRFLPGILFIICGISLWLQQPPYSTKRMISGKYLAVVIILAGVFGLAFHNVELESLQNVSIIQPFYAIMKLWPPYPLPFYAALLFVGVGFLLFFLRTSNGILFIGSQLVNFAYSSLFIIAFFIHAFKLFSEYNINTEEIPRIATLFLFALLSLGIYASRPQEGVIALLTNNTLGGMLGRRLILLPLIVLVSVSILQTAGVKYLYIEPITAYVLSLFLNLIISTLLILWVASATRKLDLNNRKLLVEHEIANKQLLSINKELDTFAYVVSHDLKAPLRGITSLAKWLKDDYSEKIDDEGKKKMNMLIDQSARMDALINGILEYSRIGRKEEKNLLVNLKALVNEIFLIFEQQGSKIRFMIDPQLPTVICPEIQMRQVFQNLIGNAVKFMDKENGVVSVKCTTTDEFWVFSVQDNGPGIDNKYFGDLFKVFTAIIPHANTETTGLGLSIVKKIVEFWGGTVWVESKLGEGSTFFFTYPRRGQ